MTIVVALFVVVVVASLAAFAVTVGGSQQHSGLTTLQTNRALAAARSGLEWGIYRARQTGWCTPGATRTQVLTLTEGALKGFQVTVNCNGHPPHVEPGGATYNTYDIDATATSGRFGSADFASQTVSGRYFSPGA
jgi:MSHA biogenesis protein MshP